jgi:hypothetical protein
VIHPSFLRVCNEPETIREHRSQAKSDFRRRRRKPARASNTDRNHSRGRWKRHRDRDVQPSSDFRRRARLDRHVDTDDHRQLGNTDGAE